MSSDCAEKESQRELLSQVFHLISQPMTALQCSLEFALNAKEDPEQRQSWVECALESSERLRSRLSLAREMAEADDGNGTTQTVELQSLLQEAFEQLQPLFETAGDTPQLSCDRLEVAGERTRLLRAFLYVLQSLTPADGGLAPGARMLSVRREGEWVVVDFQGFAAVPSAGRCALAPQLEIAGKTIEAAGGRLLLGDGSEDRTACQVFLRAAHVQLDLYSDDGLKKSAATAIDRKPAIPQVS
jgi:hypothetical protein